MTKFKKGCQAELVEACSREELFSFQNTLRFGFAQGWQAQGYLLIG